MNPMHRVFFGSVSISEIKRWRREIKQWTSSLVAGATVHPYEHLADHPPQKRSRIGARRAESMRSSLKIGRSKHQPADDAEKINRSRSRLKSPNTTASLTIHLATISAAVASDPRASGSRVKEARSHLINPATE
jgi:hypothetical protein